MREWLLALAGAALVLAAGMWIRTAWRRFRQNRTSTGRARELRQRQAQRDAQRRELHTLAGEILATSSTGTIVGYEIVRQIEAIFSEGHKSPAEAVEGLKAVARLKGANAIVHLDSRRTPQGACTARGDAVVVRPLASAGPPLTDPSPAREGGADAGSESEPRP